MEDNPSVQTANHGMLCMTGRGTCVAELILGGEKYQITLHECLHALGALVNLLSVGRMLVKGWDCEFKGSRGGIRSHCQLSYNGEVLGSLPLVGNLCHVDLRFIHPSELVSCTLRVKEISAMARPGATLDLWHARMGHPGGDLVKHLPLIATGVNIDHSTPFSQCEACIMAKHPRKLYPSSKSPRAEHMLDLIHSDLCGPFPVRTPHAKLYFVVFLDDHTHLLNVQLLATKDQALDAWRIVKSLWENHTERKVKVFRFDNGGEFISTEFTKALEEAGIEQQLTAPYAHQQNGKAERAMRTLEGHSLAMLEAAGLPSTLWGEAVLTAAYLWNRTESAALPPGKTPYEMVNNRKPDLSHLRVFGSQCWACVPTELQSKLGPKSRRAIFMGYPEGVKGYCLRDSSTGAFFVARDVIFDKDLLGNVTDDDEEEESVAPPTPSTATPQAVAALVPGTPAALIPIPATAASPLIVPRRSMHACNMTEAGKAFAEERAAAKAHLEELRDRHASTVTQGVSVNDPQGSPSSSEGVNSDEHTHADSLRPIESNGDVSDLATDVIIEEQAHVIEEQAHIAIRSDKRRDPSSPDYDMSIPPATYDEAVQRPNHEQWLEAMKTERQTMKDMNVYKVAELPEGRKAIGCRWVLEFKEDNKGGSVYKARLVAQGFSQVPGIDYGATFAPVIKPATVRLLAALGCQNDWEIDTFDVKRAFLWGVLKEEIYSEQQNRSNN